MPTYKPHPELVFGSPTLTIGETAWRTSSYSAPRPKSMERVDQTDGDGNAYLWAGVEQYNEGSATLIRDQAGAPEPQEAFTCPESATIMVVMTVEASREQGPGSFEITFVQKDYTSGS